MATITLSSNNDSGLSRSQNFEFGDDSHGRNISFSSFLNPSEEAFVRKLADSNRSFTASICSSADNDRVHLGNKKKGEDGEIGVFEAEKYFNGAMDDEDSSPRIADLGPKMYQLKEDKLPTKTTKCIIQPETPSTLRSESSWNSQSALLQTAVRNSSWKKKKPQVKGLLASLRCKCYCSDKNVVDDINHDVGEISLRKPPKYAITQDKTVTRKLVAAGIEPKNFMNEAQAKSWVHEDVSKKVNSLDFPSGRTRKPSLDEKVQLMQQAIDKEDIPRKCLEVFGSPVEKRNRSFSFDKRVVMLPWDASPGVEEIESCVYSGGIYNDAASDASSDLFEIESLNSTTTSFLARQASSASGCVTPRTCYAPSEASIEWSVVTASAAEFSLLSDCEDQRPLGALASPINIASSNGKPKPTSNEIQRRYSGLLLGCRSHKAVEVAGDACRTNFKPNKSDPQICLKRDSLPKVSRLYKQADVKLGNVNTMRRDQHSLAAQILRYSQP